MSTTTILAIVAFAIIGLLIYNSSRNIDPQDKACAKAISELIRADIDVDPALIVEQFRAFERSPEQASSTAKMVAPLLRNSGANQDERMLGMNTVLRAVGLYEQQVAAGKSSKDS